jgi:hypothetical protein
MSLRFSHRIDLAVQGNPAYAKMIERERCWNARVDRR